MVRVMVSRRWFQGLHGHSAIVSRFERVCSPLHQPLAAVWLKLVPDQKLLSEQSLLKQLVKSLSPLRVNRYRLPTPELV